MQSSQANSIIYRRVFAVTERRHDRLLLQYANESRCGIVLCNELQLALRNAPNIILFTYQIVLPKIHVHEIV